MDELSMFMNYIQNQICGWTISRVKYMDELYPELSMFINYIQNQIYGWTISRVKYIYVDEQHVVFCA